MVYHYECRKKYGGCGQTWRENREMDRRRDSLMCPNCMMTGDVLRPNPYKPQERLPVIDFVWDKMPQVISDVDHQDGRTGDGIYLPAFGDKAYSRTQIREMKKRARERHFEKTRGSHSTMVPVKDEKTGKVVMEKVTTESEGFDMGEVVEIDSSPEEANQPLSEFADGNKTLKQHDRELREELGPEE